MAAFGRSFPRDSPHTPRRTLCKADICKIMRMRSRQASSSSPIHIYIYIYVWDEGLIRNAANQFIYAGLSHVHAESRGKYRRFVIGRQFRVTRRTRPPERHRRNAVASAASIRQIPWEAAGRKPFSISKPLTERRPAGWPVRCRYMREKLSREGCPSLASSCCDLVVSAHSDAKRKATQIVALACGRSGLR
jgi:hypothetical protein